MNKLENIISVRDVCGNSPQQSLSGLDLMDAPEISARNLANIANEEYITGLTLARKKVEQATLLVRNDLMSAMAGAHVLPNLSSKRYSAGEFKTTINYPAESKERGITLYRNRKMRGSLRKLKIHTVEVYPLADKEGATLKIYDDYAGGTVTTYDLSLEKDKVNSFYPEYEVKGTFARVLLNGADLPVAGTYLTCFTGCNGNMPNDCAYTKGWYDEREISSKEGFGINLQFSCTCDYEQMLADMAKTYIGEIVWLKSRLLLMEEHLHTNRLNNWVIYGREETRQHLAELEQQYKEKWKLFIHALPGLLRQLNDDCVTCNAARWVTNL